MRKITWIIGLAIVLGVANLGSAQQAAPSPAETVYHLQVGKSNKAIDALFAAQRYPEVVNLPVGQTVRLSCGKARAGGAVLCAKQYRIDVPASATGVRVEVTGRGRFEILGLYKDPLELTEEGLTYSLLLYAESRDGKAAVGIRPVPVSAYIGIAHYETYDQTFVITATAVNPERLVSGRATSGSCEGGIPHPDTGEIIPFMCLTQYIIEVPSGATSLKIEVESGGLFFFVAREGARVEYSSDLELIYDHEGDSSWPLEIDPDSTPPLSPGTYYIALFNAEDSSQSFKLTATAITLQIPNAPSNLSATAKSSSQIDLSWQDNSDNEEGFKIERKIQGESYSQIATVGANVTTYSDTGLNPNTTYCYRVRAYNAAGNSAYSNESCATTLGIEIPTYEFSATLKQGEFGRIEIPDDIKSKLPFPGITFEEKPNTTKDGRRSDSLSEVGLQLSPSTGTIFGTPTKAGNFQFLLEAKKAGQLVAVIWVVVTIEEVAPPPPPSISLTSGEAKKGTVEAGPKKLSTQYTIEVPEGTAMLLIRLRNQERGNIDLHIRLGSPVEIIAGEVVAGFSSTSPTGTESLSISGAQLQPGTYYIAVENQESSSQEFIILAATVPVLVSITSGASVTGTVEAAGPGDRVLALTQYVVEVPEGAKRLTITLESLEVGDLNLHIRYGKAVEIIDGKVVADFSATSDSAMGIESITISAPHLVPGRYYIAIENLEPYPQDFKLTVELRR